MFVTIILIPRDVMTFSGKSETLIVAQMKPSMVSASTKSIKATRTFSISAADGVA